MSELKRGLHRYRTANGSERMLAPTFRVFDIQDLAKVESGIRSLQLAVLYRDLKSAFMRVPVGIKSGH